MQKRSLVISVLRKLFPCPISCHLIRRISCHVGPSHLISFHLIQPRRIQKRKQESKQGRKKAYAASKQGTKGKKYARRAQLRNQPTKTPDDRPFENQVFVPEYMGKDKTENICQYISKWMLDNISRQIRAEINKEKYACPRFVHGCAHTDIHTSMHAYIQTQTCIHVYMHTGTKTCMHASVNTCKNAYVQTSVHDNTDRCKLRAHTHIHTYVQTKIHTNINTYTHPSIHEAYTDSNAHIYGKKFGSQTCNLLTDAAAADGRGRKEDARRKTIKVCEEDARRKTIKVCEKEVCNVFRLRRIEKCAFAKAAAAPSGQKRNQYVPAAVVKKSVAKSK